MKTLAVFLLVAALCVEEASSLACYKCENVKSHQECTHRIKCSDMDRHCVSLYNETPGQQLSISKWCAVDCPALGSEAKGGRSGVKVNCCGTDYCNSGGLSSVKTSYAVMVMAALVSLLGILRTGF